MNIVVLVPYRPDGGHRDHLWNYLQRCYWKPLGWPIIQGRHNTGPFNRSAAINDAARTAGDWDIAVIADADTWVPPANLKEAIALTTSGLLVSALTSVVELSLDCTHALLRNAGHVDIGDFGFDRVRVDELATQSSMIVITRTLWDHIGGFDEQFIGWGGEDNAFWKAATILAGTPLRIDGCAFHLWHEPAANINTRRRDPEYLRNLNRWRTYARARTERQLRAAQQ